MTYEKFELLVRVSPFLLFLWILAFARFSRDHLVFDVITVILHTLVGSCFIAIAKDALDYAIGGAWIFGGLVWVGICFQAYLRYKMFSRSVDEIHEFIKKENHITHLLRTSYVPRKKLKSES